MKKIDRLDRKIIHELVRDGRVKVSELSDRVGLSTSPCWDRVRRLESDGYIRGYTALLDHAKLGVPDTVFVEVTLDRHDDGSLDVIGHALAELPEVLEIHLTTGDYDFLVKVAVTGTQGYENFLTQKLYKLSGIRQARSRFVLSSVKQSYSMVPEE